MTPEEIAALRDEIISQTTQLVTASADALKKTLIEAKIIPDPEAPPAVEPDGIAFEGDPTNQADIQAHLKKIEAAEGARILASGDKEKITAYLASLVPPKGTATGKTSANKQPAGNLDISGQGLDDEASKKKADAKDTVEFMVGLMPAR